MIKEKLDHTSEWALIKSIVQLCLSHALTICKPTKNDDNLIFYELKKVES
jgi:hypothetical protein